jgi:aryl-alcohol dehydrogenase-like predicted oxidoreductase
MTASTLALGDTLVHRLGFGTMSLTGSGVWGDPRDPAEARRVLRRAVELGVDVIDTADSYGPGVAEKLVAEALHPYEGIVVATKGGLTRQGPGRWSRNCRPEYLRAACHASLERLRVERIDLYQLHTVDPAVPIEDSVGALEELRGEGKIAAIGVCNVDETELDRARAVAPVVSVQNRFSLADRSSLPLAERCAREGLAFLAWAPLAKGTLTGSNPTLGSIAVKHGATAAQIALAWILATSEAAVPIPGTSSVEHLEENISAAAERLSTEELTLLDQTLFSMTAKGGRRPAARRRLRRLVGR